MFVNSDTQVQKVISEIRDRAGLSKRIVFVSGNFNVIHPGHLRLLTFAAECGDFLVVGVTGNHSNGAIVPEELRLEGIRAISFVDYSFTIYSVVAVVEEHNELP